MAESNLNKLFSLEQQITFKEAELKNLKKLHDEIMAHVIKSGPRENKYYYVDVKIRAGNRQIQTVLLKEKYPDIYAQCVEEVVYVGKAQKLLGDDQITEVSIRDPDKYTYKVLRKEQAGVITV